MAAVCEQRENVAPAPLLLLDEDAPTPKASPSGRPALPDAALKGVPAGGKRSPKVKVATSPLAASGAKSPVSVSTPTGSTPTEAQKKAARDNAVTAQLTKTKMCAFFSRGRCASTNCRYAHCVEELRTLPNLQKTKLCRAFLTGACTEGENCPFAHGEQDLRVTEGIYKTQICNFHERGYCKKGDRCNHAHGPTDLRPQTPHAMKNAQDAEKSATPLELLPQPGPKPRGARSPLPLAELLLDDENAGTPTPTKAVSPLGPYGGAAGYSPGISPVGLGMPQTPDTWMQSAYQLHPTSPSAMGMHGIPARSPMPREPLDVLLGHANPQSGTPGPLVFDHVQAAAMSQQQYRAEATQALQQQQAAAPLDERLASLDAVVRNLAADVRSLAVSRTEAGNSRENEAAAAKTMRHRI